MSAVRRLGALIAACVALLAVTAAPAGAHGATSNPISRAYACGPEGSAAARSAACRAADAVNGAAVFAAWDQLRVSGVAGRDRAVIPDGRLCSAGIGQFHGLDLARTDWPATRLVAGTNYTFRYRETIPHQGTFRLYVTRDGYLPTRPLRWADLQAAPFLTVPNPPIAGASYVFQGRLPQGKTGRHLIYTIWQNTSTPDTYYSCSDVVFVSAAGSPAGSAPARPPATTPAGRAAGSAAPPAGRVASPAATTAVPARLSPAADQGTDRKRWLLLLAVALVVLALGLAAALAMRRRRPGYGPEHRA